MTQQTEHRAIISDRYYVGFVVPDQYITIYRADDEFKPFADGLEAVWTFRSETVRWGTKPTLNEGDIRRHFVNRDVESPAKQTETSSFGRRMVTNLKLLLRDFTIPPMSVASLILAACMLFVGILILIDAPALGPLLGGMVIGGALLLVLFAIFGPFIW